MKERGYEQTEASGLEAPGPREENACMVWLQAFFIYSKGAPCYRIGMIHFHGGDLGSGEGRRLVTCVLSMHPYPNIGYGEYTSYARIARTLYEDSWRKTRYNADISELHMAFK
jgi:hypothetical protein